MQISRILIPTDFSPLSRLALRYAIALALKVQARLTLLHIVETGTAFSDAFPTIEGRLTREHVQQARRMLPALLSSSDRDRLSARLVVRTGEIPETILSTAKQERADLLVMGTHGRSLVASALMGSVTAHVLKDASFPVLTIGHVDRFPVFGKILFATDLDNASRRVVAFAADLARAARSQLVATHVTNVGVHGGAEAAVYLEDRRIEDARSKLKALLAEVHRPGTEIDVRPAEGSVAETILRSADEHKADLLIIEASRQGDQIIASPERIVRKAHIPVVCVPAGIDETARETKAA
jgi:universal stress protein A